MFQCYFTRQVTHKHFSDLILGKELKNGIAGPARYSKIDK